MRSSILRYASIGLATIGLGLGVAAADSANIDTTGPHSNNQVDSTNNSRVRLTNDNDVDVRNDNDQDARSGNARVSGNTSGGSAESGDASNDASSSTDVSVSNGSGLGSWGGFFSGNSNDASINLTGPNSNNQIRFTNNQSLNVRNDNDIDVRNDNDQDARSGSATVSGNTIGGDASSGSVSNSYNSSTSVNVEN